MPEFNFVSSIEPLIIFLKVFGLYSFKFERIKSFSTSTLSVPHLLYSIILTSVPIFFVISACLYKKVPFLFELWRILALIGSFLILIQLIRQIYDCHGISKFFRYFEEFDRACEKSGIFIDHEHELKCILVLTSSIVLVFFYVGVTNTLIYLQEEGLTVIELHIAHCYQLLLCYIFIVQFCTLTMILSRRFNAINKYLQNAAVTFNISGQLTNLQQFINLHWNLTCLIRKFNLIFTSNLSITLFNTLFNAILSMYWSVYAIYRGKDDEHTNHVIVDGSWMLVNLILLIIICKAGHSVKSSAEMTELILLKSLAHARHDIIKRELKFIHYSVKNSSVRIENTFFAIDWKLLLMVSCREMEPNENYNNIFFIQFSDGLKRFNLHNYYVSIWCEELDLYLAFVLHILLLCIIDATTKRCK